MLQESRCWIVCFGIMYQRGDLRIYLVGGIVTLSEGTKEVDAVEYSAAFIMQP